MQKRLPELASIPAVPPETAERLDRKMLRYARKPTGLTDDDEKRLVPIKKAYGLWLGLPSPARREDEKTREEFAAKYKVHRNTLTNWESKGDPIVQEARIEAVKTLGGNHMQEVIDKLVELALAGSYQHQRLYLEWMQQIGQHVRVDDLRPSEIEINVKTSNNGPSEKPKD